MPITIATNLSPERQAAAEIYKDTGEVAPELRCPITHEALQHPVRIGAEGKQLFSEDALAQWIQRSPTNPLTRASLYGQQLLREPQAMAAINTVRRDAAALHREADDPAGAARLLAEADQSEKEAAARPVPVRLLWPEALPNADRAHVDEQYVAYARLGLRVGMALVVGTWVGQSLGNWWMGFVPPEPLRTAAVAASAVRGANFMLATPTDRAGLALSAAYVSAAALGRLMPASAHLLGFAVGMGVLLI